MTNRDDDIYEELLNIRYLLEVIASHDLKARLEEILTTPERKKVWNLCNGSISTSELAKRAGLTPRAVQIIVKELAEKDMVSMLRRGVPKRRFDYIPSDWEMEE